MPGVPLVYALRYMARRVISVVGAYGLLSSQSMPRTVLDVGSGTGATALAFDLLHPASRVSVVGIEPSREMRNLAESLSLRGLVSARYRQGSVADIIANPALIRACDLLVFSACFPYEFDRWEEIGASLGDYRSSDSRAVLVIEPDAKSDALDALQRVFRGRGWPTVMASSRDVPAFMTRGDLPLNRITRVWRRAGAPGAHAPASWWSPPDDRFLIANPAPVWPSGIGDVRHTGASRLAFRESQ